MFILCILFFTRRLFPWQVYLQRLKVVPSLCRLHPNSPSHLTRQEADPPETTYPAAPVSDWRVNQTNHTPTSPFSPANHLARTSTHNLRRNHGRLSPQRSIEIWQLHRWDNRQRLFHFTFQFFSRSTIHCEPGVVTLKKQPFEVKSFRQHEQKEKGLEDWKR